MDFRVGIEHPRQACRHPVDFDAGELRAGGHRLGHEPEEVAQAAGRLQHPSVREPESADRGIHRLNDGGRRVVSVEDRRPGRIEARRLQQLLHQFLFLFPARSLGGRGEHLRHPAPAGVFDEFGLLRVGRAAALRLDLEQEFQGGDVLLELPAQRAFAQPVGVGDAVVGRVADYAFASGGRRMYFSRTSSQAWS